MHELPNELTESLRSWRGSVYGNRTSLARDEVDLEKGEDVISEQDHNQRWWHNRPGAVILHPTKSTQGLHQAYLERQQRTSGQPLLPDHPRAIDTTVPNDAEYRRQIQFAPSAQRQGTFPPQTASTGKASIFANAPKVADPDPAADRLDDETTPLTPADFYELMGMRPPTSKMQNPSELRLRHGLYARIYHDMEYVQTKYRVFDVLAYAFLILQLLLSALFIVLGSLTSIDSHITIAVLGAVSTVIAGALALMKGQGLPNRLRQARDGLRNVVFEAEELYWDVGAERAVFYKDIKKVREDYLRVMENNRRNHPDMWTAPASKIAQGIVVPSKTPQQGPSSSGQNAAATAHSTVQTMAPATAPVTAPVTTAPPSWKPTATASHV